MKRLLIAVLVLGGCATTPTTPPPPPLYDLSIIVTSSNERVDGAIVEVDGFTFTTNQFGGIKTEVAAGEHELCAAKVGYEHRCETLTIHRHTRKVFGINLIIPPLQPIQAVSEHRMFIDSTGGPWRWKGVSAFRLLDAFAHGQDLQPFFATFKGFNLLRVWVYTPWKDQQGNFIGWPITDQITTLRFLKACEQAGFYVELTLLTDNDPTREREARDLMAFLVEKQPPNLLVEIANEPDVNHIQTEHLTTLVGNSGFPWTSGDYDPSNTHKGTYLTYHTPRDNEWPRKSKGLREFWDGGGPTYPTEPALHLPAIADEPIRPDQAGYAEEDYYAYFALASIMGGGATFHYEGGKWARLPDTNEAKCLRAALAGLSVFPLDAVEGGYRRIDEQTLRTYIIGHSMVRVRPRTPEPPELGWTPLDTLHIAWTK